MSKLSCLFILWVVCGSAFSSDEDNGYERLSDYGSIFDDKDSGVASLASSPLVAAMLEVDKSQYKKLFDTVVSSSIDSLQSRLAPRENIYDANYFQPNQGFQAYGTPAKLVAQPQQQTSPAQYDIRTIHDPNYIVYKDEEQDETRENLTELKQRPPAAHSQPYVNVKVNHPLQYRKEELIERFDGEQNYKHNPYIAGSGRIRRYTGGRRSESLKAAEGAEDDPYNYSAEYISKPKAFDESPYSSPYKKKKGADDKYDYPYSYDTGYDHKEYERIKQLSEKQAAEIKQNPGNCKEVKKDGMSCMTCKDPKTGGNYESCSYVAEPKNNQYAYSKEKKYDSNDEPDEGDNKSQSPKKAEKIQSSNEEQTSPQTFSETVDKPYSRYRQADTGKESAAESVDKPYSRYRQADTGKESAAESVDKPYSRYRQADTGKESGAESVDKPYSRYRQADTGKESGAESVDKPYSRYRQADTGNDSGDESADKAYSRYRQADNGNNSGDDSVDKSYGRYRQADNGNDSGGDSDKPYSRYRQTNKAVDPSDDYKAYYIHSKKPTPSESLRAASEEDNSDETKPKKSYDYKKVAPGFYTDNEPKKDVEHVLAEFKKKDRSACKKVKKNAMTCFQCIGDDGLKNEECMFVSESAPKQSHLAYQELKEFTSKPATLDDGSETAESQTVTTNAPVAHKSAAYEAATTNYNKKLKRKKAPALAVAASNPVAKSIQKVKRSEGSQAFDASNIAPPEEFAGAESKPAFWAEIAPRYSAALGVTLPEYMLTRSDHEASFDEAVAGA